MSDVESDVVCARAGECTAAFLLLVWGLFRKKSKEVYSLRVGKGVVMRR